MPSLSEPHHDGSPLYVSTDHPRLGEEVRVRVHVPATAEGGPPAAIHLRTTVDAEPVFTACTPEEDGGWWSASVRIHNPLTHYRFALVGAEGDQRWLNGAGIFDHDVPDAFDFKLCASAPAPDWARDGVVYQIFPDRFARSAAADERPTPAWAQPAGWQDTVEFEPTDPRTPAQFFGGDLDGITEHLDHVAALGADIVYLTPVFPAESNHRYNASTFTEVDPLLGGDAAYLRLAEAVHEHGWHLVGDLTTNHTGDTHEWFRRALADPEGPERDYYYFDEHGGYESWLGVSTLPKLDHQHADLRAALVEGPDSVVARWLREPVRLDGWRIDVANMTGRLREVDVNHLVGRAVRETALAERPDALVIGEHNHDASPDVNIGGWHGVMNYSGFSWPVWEWLRAADTPARPFGTPMPIASRGGPQITTSMRLWMGRLGWLALSSSWNILGSHDSARIRTITGSPAIQQVAAGLQFTLPGVPMVFAGDEIGLQGINGEDARRPMPWEHPEEWEAATLATYAALADLRREHEGLRRGGLRWAHADQDALVFLREHPQGRFLVCARRAAGPSIAIGPLPGADPRILMHLGAIPDEVSVAGDDLVLPAAEGPGFAVLAL